MLQKCAKLHKTSRKIYYRENMSPIPRNSKNRWEWGLIRFLGIISGEDVGIDFVGSSEF